MSLKVFVRLQVIVILLYMINVRKKRISEALYKI
jgi:hypothetical protein